MRFNQWTKSILRSGSKSISEITQGLRDDCKKSLFVRRTWVIETLWLFFRTIKASDKQQSKNSTSIYYLINEVCSKGNVSTFGVDAQTRMKFLKFFALICVSLGKQLLFARRSNFRNARPSCNKKRKYIGNFLRKIYCTIYFLNPTRKCIILCL